MASVSVSHLIIFIAAMLVAASTAGLLTSTVEDLSTAIEEEGFSTSDEIRSDLTIINDAGTNPTAINSTDGTLTLYVKNTGSSELSTQPGDVDILINGIFVVSLSESDISLLGGAEVWGQGTVAEITVTDEQVIDPGENRAQVTVEGAEDVFIWEQ